MSRALLRKNNSIIIIPIECMQNKQKGYYTSSHEGNITRPHLTKFAASESIRLLPLALTDIATFTCLTLKL